MQDWSKKVDKVKGSLLGMGKEEDKDGASGGKQKGSGQGKQAGKKVTAVPPKNTDGPNPEEVQAARDEVRIKIQTQRLTRSPFAGSDAEYTRL